PHMNIFVESLLDKINLIAKHSHKSFITDDMLMLIDTKEKDLKPDLLKQMIDDVLDDIKDPIVKESLQLIKGHMAGDLLQKAVLKGLLHNISTDPLCKEISYFCRLYLNEGNDKKDKRITGKRH